MSFAFWQRAGAGGAPLKCAVGRRSEIELNIWQITFIKSAGGELENEKTIQELLTFEDQSNWMHTTTILGIKINISAAQHIYLGIFA